jgi:predicted NACHT family NTPase
MGGPGSGKSSALREYVLQWAETFPSSPVPQPLRLLVELNKYGAMLASNPTHSLEDYIATGGCNMNKEALVAAFESTTQGALLLLDRIG